MVLLHGLYSNPWQVIHYRGITEEAEKRGYLVVAPYGYNEGGWYGSRGKGKDAGLHIAPPPNSPDNLGELSEKDVLNVLALVMRKNYAVDPKRIYLMGHSMGGGGTLYLGYETPGHLGGAGPVGSRHLHRSGGGKRNPGRTGHRRAGGLGPAGEGGNYPEMGG